MVEQHLSFPSIYTWVIYNEGWGQLASAPETYLAPRVRTMDPTRLVNAVSGWTDHGVGDYSDNHHVCPFLSALMNLTTSIPTRNAVRLSTRGPLPLTTPPESDSKVNSAVSVTTSPLSSMFFQHWDVVIADNSLWNNKRAIDAIDQTYELDLTLDVWNERAVCTRVQFMISS
jgi:hypothetical protein